LAYSAMVKTGIGQIGKAGHCLFPEQSDVLTDLIGTALRPQCGHMCLNA